MGRCLASSALSLEAFSIGEQLSVNPHRARLPSAMNVFALSTLQSDS